MSPEPPEGLQAAGTALWTQYTGAFELGERELAVLLLACRTRDELTQIEDLLAKSAPLLRATGSAGQATVRTNPLLAEARAHRASLNGLLASLAEDSPSSGAAASKAAQELAFNRWRKSRRASNA